MKLMLLSALTVLVSISGCTTVTPIGQTTPADLSQACRATCAPNVVKSLNLYGTGGCECGDAHP